MKTLAIISSFFLISTLSAQHVNFNSQKNWSLNKKELQFGFGATQFNGDLGGGPTEGIDNSPKDIDWKSTGISGMVGFRYRFHPLFSTSSTLSFSTLKGDDKYSEETVRKARNLHFKSGVLEFQQKLEFIVFSKEQFSPTYNSPGAQAVKNRNQQYYIFGGLGVAYHNPKALYQGDWVALRPLMTEGQDKAYSPFVLTIPMGIGLGVGLPLLTWGCLLSLNMLRNPKIGLRSGKSRMSRGMEIQTLLRRTASSPSGMATPYLNEGVRLLQARGHSSTNRKTSKKIQSSHPCWCKGQLTGCGDEVH